MRTFSYAFGVTLGLSLRLKKELGECSSVGGALVVDQINWSSGAVEDFVTVEFRVGHGFSPPLAIPSQPYQVMVGEASHKLRLCENKNKKRS